MGYLGRLARCRAQTFLALYWNIGVYHRIHRQQVLKGPDWLLLVIGHYRVIFAADFPANIGNRRAVLSGGYVLSILAGMFGLEG
jgi:hypothetical protein